MSSTHIQSIMMSSYVSIGLTHLAILLGNTLIQEGVILLFLKRGSDCKRRFPKKNSQMHKAYSSSATVRYSSLITSMFCSTYMACLLEVLLVKSLHNRDVNVLEINKKLCMYRILMPWPSPGCRPPVLLLLLRPALSSSCPHSPAAQADPSLSLTRLASWHSRGATYAGEYPSTWNP